MKIIAQARQTLLSNLPPRARCAEVGVFKGDFSASILKMTAPAELHLIDPWISVARETHKNAMYGVNNRSQEDMDAIYQSVVKRFADDTKVVQIHRKTSSDALRALPRERLDWIYLDGDHTYDAVLEDLRLSADVVRAGGFIAGDDYVRNNWFGDGVIRALHEFLHEQAARMKIVFIMDTQFLVQKL